MMNAKEAAEKIDNELVGGYSRSVDVWEHGFVDAASDIIQQCVDDALEAAAEEVESYSLGNPYEDAAGFIREMKSNE